MAEAGEVEEEEEVRRAHSDNIVHVIDYINDHRRIQI